MSILGMCFLEVKSERSDEGLSSLPLHRSHLVSRHWGRWRVAKGLEVSWRRAGDKRAGWIYRD